LAKSYFEDDLYHFWGIERAVFQDGNGAIRRKGRRAQRCKHLRKTAFGCKCLPDANGIYTYPTTGTPRLKEQTPRDSLAALLVF
jgi:hypothetical protein